MNRCGTDIGAPTSLVLQALERCVRARQFWDPRHTLASVWPRTPTCGNRPSIAASRSACSATLAAVYPPGEVWASQIPAAAFFDGPVVKCKRAWKPR